MTGDPIGPGKVLEGFESLIFSNDNEETTPLTGTSESPPQIAQSDQSTPQEDRSDYNSTDQKQGELTKPHPRNVQKIFRS